MLGCVLRTLFVDFNVGFKAIKIRSRYGEDILKSVNFIDCITFKN